MILKFKIGILYDDSIDKASLMDTLSGIGTILATGRAQPRNLEGASGSAAILELEITGFNNRPSLDKFKAVCDVVIEGIKNLSPSILKITTFFPSFEE